MKLALALALALGCSFANAAITCRDGWNRPGTIKGNLDAISLNFSGYPASGTLYANGQSSDSYFFRKNSGTFAEVEKSVLSTGKGKIYFHYPNSNPNKMPNLAIFYCD